ncbi:MAG: xanthine dehydrogenase family protein molybdopterin-binding subunit [Fimbriimonadaceae bacterium]
MSQPTILREDPSVKLSRRTLFKLLGGGILLAAFEPDAWAAGWAQRGSPQLPQQISAWVHVGTDGRISVFSGKVEVGQNCRTSLTQAAAEELRVPIQAVTVTLGDTDLVPFDMGTFGSRTTPTMVPQVRRAAASARETLIDLAAKKWGVARDAIHVSNGQVTGPGRQSETYGAIAKDQPVDGPITLGVPLTPPSDWKILGTSVGKISAEEIVTGKHKYASDMRRDGMLFAKVLRPPSFGATVTSADTSKAAALPGVSVVRDGDFIAVAAPTTRLAVRAISAIAVSWQEMPQPSSKDLPQLLRPTPPTTPAWSAPTKLLATYTASYIAHVPLEPRAAFAEWTGGKMTVYTGTQRPFAVRTEVATALGIPEARVRVVVPDTGSGYGGKHTGDAAVEAARIAKAVGKPIMLLWTRAEEFTFAYFRPAGVIDIASGAMADGALSHWEFDNYNSGGAAIGTPYAAPEPRTEYHEVHSPLRQGSYRSLAAAFNNFSRESHMDELAHALGLDPLAFRLKNLTNSRLAAVLTAAANEFGWGGARPTENHGFGLACGTEKGSQVATAVEVSVDPQTKAVRLERIVTAYECGAILNPELLKLQVEGAVIMGIGGALFEAIEFANGRILTNHLSKYRVPRYSDVPPMTTLLLDRKDLPSAGAGETPIIAIAPAIGNAIFAATGMRLRDLPMKLPAT